MTNIYYWLLPNSSIAISSVFNEDIKPIDTKPHLDAVLITPSSVPPDLSTSSLWRYDSIMNAIYINQELENKKKWNHLRIKRNTLLAESDVLLIRAIETGKNVELLKSYRQALRDITIEDNPDKLIWPTLPE